MAFVHGWKAFSIVPSHGGKSLQDDEGGHLHNALSTENEPGWSDDEGFHFYTTLEGAQRDTPSVYAHVTCLGKTVLHERGGRTNQYSVDYFLRADWTGNLRPICDNLNVGLLLPDDKLGCPVCHRGEATEVQRQDWFGDGYGR